MLRSCSHLHLLRFLLKDLCTYKAALNSSLHSLSVPLVFVLLYYILTLLSVFQLSTTSDTLQFDTTYQLRLHIHLMFTYLSTLDLASGWWASYDHSRILFLVAATPATTTTQSLESLFTYATANIGSLSENFRKDEGDPDVFSWNVVHSGSISFQKSSIIKWIYQN